MLNYLKRSGLSDRLLTKHTISLFCWSIDRVKETSQNYFSVDNDTTWEMY